MDDVPDAPSDADVLHEGVLERDDESDIVTVADAEKDCDCVELLDAVTVAVLLALAVLELDAVLVTVEIHRPVIHQHEWPQQCRK